MKYFVDTDIYFQGKRQPPRRIPVYDAKVSNGKVFCRDALDNHYTLNENEVFEDNLTEDTFIIEHYKGSLWVSAADKFKVYYRKPDSTFELIATLPFDAKDDPALFRAELEAQGINPTKYLLS